MVNVLLPCKSRPLQPSGPLDPEPRGCCPLFPSHRGPLNPARVSEELPVIPWGRPMEPNTPAQLGAGDLAGWGGHFGGSPARNHSANQQTAASPSHGVGVGRQGGPCHVLQPSNSRSSEILSPTSLGWGVPIPIRAAMDPQTLPHDKGQPSCAHLG